MLYLSFGWSRVPEGIYLYMFRFSSTIPLNVYVHILTIPFINVYTDTNMELRDDLEWKEHVPKCQIANEEEFLTEMKENLKQAFNTNHVKKIEETTTGFVNKSALFEINHKKYFLKYNDESVVL